LIHFYKRQKCYYKSHQAPRQPLAVACNMQVSLMTNQWLGNLEMTKQRPEIKLVK